MNFDQKLQIIPWSISFWILLRNSLPEIIEIVSLTGQINQIFMHILFRHLVEQFDMKDSKSEKYQWVIPQELIRAIDLWTRWAITIWRDDSTTNWAVNGLHPQINGSTCCTTCLWLSHTGLSVDSKVNPLAPCVVQTECLVHLVRRLNKYHAIVR